MEPDINKNLTDEQLDDLILQSLHRQQMVDDINVAVMKQLRRTTRRRSLLRWGHFDLYRIGDVSELEEIGLPYAIDNDITLIEWPEIAKDILPSNTIHIYITQNGDGRKLVLQ